MPAYLIGTMAISDTERYGRYKVHTPEIVAKYGGRFLARGGERLDLEGEGDGRRVVIVEFSSLQDAEKFYYSKEYQAARLIRDGAADINIFVVEGFETS